MRIPKMEEIRKALSDRNLRKVSESTGVTYGTLARIVRGEIEPRYSDAEALVKYLWPIDEGK